MPRHQLSFALILFSLAPLMAAAEDFDTQSISYDISYKCAFINEVAAHATVDISYTGNRYTACIAGSSVPILGTIYSVNDTLVSTFDPKDTTCRPAPETILYMSGYYRKPHVGEPIDLDAPANYRTIDGAGYLSASESTMECVTLTTDMLCMFYYAKMVDFDAMPLSTAVDVPIRQPSGRLVTLQVVCNGLESFNGRPVYSLTCNYTYDGALSQYPITLYIDVIQRIPVYIGADIKIGKVAMTHII